MSPVLAVGAIIVREDGAVLLVQRGRPPLEGAWSLPGGKVEPGEPLPDAIQREVLEETGLSVDVAASVDVVTLEGEGRVFEIHELLCHPSPGADPDAVRPGDDARDVRWVMPSTLAELGVTREVQRVVGVALAMRRAP